MPVFAHAGLRRGERSMKHLVAVLPVCLALAALAWVAASGARPLAARPIAQGHYPGPAPAAVDQTDPDITYFSACNEYVLVWSEDRGDGARLYAKRLQNTGNPLGGPLGGEYELTGPTGPGGTKGEQRWPAISDGIVVWSEKAPAGTHYDLYAQRLTENGLTIGQPHKLVDTPSNQKQADVVRSAAHEWLVVWGDDAVDAGDIWGLRVTDALMPRGKAAALVTGPSTSEDPAVHGSTADLGYFMLLWADNRQGNWDIFEQSISRTLTPRPGYRGQPSALIASPLDENTPAIGKIPADDPAALARPPIAGQAAGTQIYYTVSDATAMTVQVTGQRLRLNGWPVGPEIAIGPKGGIGAAPAAVLDTMIRHRYLVVWQGKLDPTDLTVDLYGTEVDRLGTVYRSPVLLVE